MANEPASPSQPADNSPDVPASERTTVDFDQPDKLVGEKLDGRFMIEKNLTEGGADSGGIGVVYLAKDTKLMGKDVVVKILNETALKHPDIVRKFQHEKEALIRLDHPGIVRIVDSGTLLDGNPFMVMDYIQGHSLRKALQLAGRLPIEVAAHIIESVTDALTAAHSQHILHRDIKPENIMLTPLEEGRYRVRIIDFGIARVGDSELAPATQISRAIGSALYIAPEQLMGNLDLSPAADIFAMGIVAYEMLTGEVPFKPKSLAEMYQLEKEGVKTLPSTLRPEIPRKAESILMTALEFEAHKRPQNARAFGRYLAHELRVDNTESTDRFFASIGTEFAQVPTLAMPAVDPAELETVERAPAPEPVTVPPAVPAAPVAVPVPVTQDTQAAQTSAPRSSGLKWAAAFLLLLVIAVPAVYFGSSYIGSTAPPANVAGKPSASGMDRTLSYFLTVQKVRSGKNYEAPFKSSGQEIFESGYKFKMTFQSEAAGFIYVFNESKDAQGQTNYSLLFPTASVNRGVADVTAGQQIETVGNQFTGERGTEVMWLIWSATKENALDEAVRSANASSGTLKDAASYAELEDFLAKYRSDPREVVKDAAEQRTVIKGKGDVLVHRFELEHR